MVKSLVYLFFPLPLCLGLIFWGLFLLWFTNKQRLARVVITVACAFLVLFSNRGLSQALLRSLEQKHPAVVGEWRSGESMQAAKYVVILGGMLNCDEDLPLTSQLNSTMLVRLVEGLRIYKNLPSVKVVVSGMGECALGAEKIVLDMAKLLGVKEGDIILEARPTNTYEEAVCVKEIVRDEKLILVTSARHMARAVRLFRRLGMLPIPAPTNHLVRESEEFPFDALIPNSGYLWLTREVFYEFLAGIKEKLLARM